MSRLLVRGLAARKLRSILTGLAILLGVAMIAGTYVETDTVNRALKDVLETANRRVDVVVSPRSDFESQFTEPRPLPASLIRRVQRVRGIAVATGQIQATGSLVVKGRYLGRSTRAPSLVLTILPPRLRPGVFVRGRAPSGHGEVAVNRNLARDHHLSLGARVGLATRTGVKPVTLVGVFDFGHQGSLGASSIVTTTFTDAQAWFDRRGQTSIVIAGGEAGARPEDLARRVRAALPTGVKVQTGKQNADSRANQLSSSIGSFLTPALLALSGAALLVGAFIIFNTFSITVAQRVREFALLRVLGATPRQILLAVIGEAIMLGAVASGLGLLCGVGFARLLNALFAAVGFDLPATGIVLEARTVIVALTIGLGTTVLAALIPARRATRVPEALAMREGIALPKSRISRYAPHAAVVLSVLGLAGVAQGLFGGGPATTKLATLGTGAVLVFVGVAMSARWVVRPLAKAVGWPIERAFRTPGRLARENAIRNPARTATTAAALMVGLGLVVFVAVFANGLKASIADSVTRLLRSDFIVAAQGGAIRPIPGPTARAVGEVPGVHRSVSVLFDQIRVDRSRRPNLTTDTLEGVDPRTIGSVYAPEWLSGGSNSLFGKLGAGNALIEQQFAKTHRLAVGKRFAITTPSGRRTVLTAIGEYKDPQVLQGMIVDTQTFARASAVRDPFIVLVRQSSGARSSEVKAGIEHALRGFPEAEVQSNRGYREQVQRQLNQLIYLLYALLGMSLVISVFGIANSLALAIHERMREIGTLEAIGATGVQVRRIVRYESVITAVIGGLLGTVVGLVLAWLMTRALADLGLSFSVPPGQLALFLVLAVAVGVVAAVGPARRAAHVDVLDALRYE